MATKDQNTADSLETGPNSTLSTGGVVRPAPPSGTTGVPLSSGGRESRFSGDSPGSGSRRRLLTIMLVVLLAGAGLLAFVMANRSQSDHSNQAANGFGTVEIPLHDVLADKNLSLAGASNVTINGSLQLNNSFTLAPSPQPTGAKPGQIYFDQGTNQLAYYNGSSFVFLTGPSPVTGIQSLDGVTGQLTLGDGLSVGGGEINNDGVLSVQGQTGAITFTAGAGITINGTTFVNGGVLNVVAGTPNVTVTNDGSGTVTISVASGSGVDSLNGLSGALTIANASAAGSTVTIDDASTSAKGIASFNASNFSVTSGAVNTIQNIGTGASPTFAAVNTNNIVPSGALAVGSTGQSFTLQGTSASIITATNGANTTTLSFAAPTANRAIVFPDEAGTVCMRNSTNCGFASSGSFINNSTTLQTNANIAIQSAADASVTLLVKARASQTADFLRVVNSSDALLFNVNAFGIAQFTQSVSIDKQLGVGIPQSSSDALRVAVTAGSQAGITIYGVGSSLAPVNDNILQAFGASTRSLVYNTAGTLQITAGSGQSANLLAFQNTGGEVVSAFNASGQLILGRISASGTAQAGSIQFADGTNDNFGSTLNTATLTANRTISLPNESGTICLQNSTNCGFSTGSGSFINNSSTLQTNANIAIQSASDSDITMLLKNRPTQSADILRVVHSNDNLVFKIDTFGGAQFAGPAEFQSYMGIGFAGAASAGATLRIYTVQDANFGIVLNGNGGQTADMFQINTQNVLGVFVVSSSGSVVSKNASNSTTAFQIQRADATPVFTVDTTGNKVVVAALDVTGNLTVNGHIVSGGSAPSIAAGAAACTSPTVSVSGTDTAGLITVTSGTGCGAGGKLATITFNTAFGAAPRVVLTAAGSAAAGLHYYVDNATIATTTFDVTTQAGDTITDATTYRWYYHVIQ